MPDLPPDPTARAVPTPDRSVRMAWVADAAAMGRAQARAWGADCRGLLPATTLEALREDDLAAGWADALRRPPTATHRALVALEGNTVVGFAAVAPCGDPDADPLRDGEVTVLVLDPDARGRGHGSRLLAAVADTGRADGFSRLTMWLVAQDDDLRSFLESAGWAADGAHREMILDSDTDSDTGTADEPPVRQVRLHTALEDR